MEKIVHFSRPLQEKIEQRGEDFSTIIQRDLECYYAILDMVEDEMKDQFSIKEASLLCNVFRSTQMEIRRLKSWPTLFVWDVEDVEKYERLGEQFEVDTNDLINKLEKLTPYQALWLWDKIRLFWNKPDLIEKEEETIKVLFGIEI